jgi:uncharacterized YigZ family protein
MPTDSYFTIAAPSEGAFTMQRSRFLAFAFPVATAEDAKIHVEALRKQYYDARHVCWAWMLGADRSLSRVNDDSEPSSTAGRPILGVINSNSLTDILIAVVRYFGGVKLGTSGLIEAYRTAAAEAIAAANIVERTVNETLDFTFDYRMLNDVMRLVKEFQPTIIEQQFDTECRICLSIRSSMVGELQGRLQKVKTLFEGKQKK